MPKRPQAPIPGPRASPRPSGPEALQQHRAPRPVGPDPRRDPRPRRGLRQGPRSPRLRRPGLWPPSWPQGRSMPRRSRAGRRAARARAPEARSPCPRAGGRPTRVERPGRWGSPSGTGPPRPALPWPLLAGRAPRASARRGPQAAVPARGAWPRRLSGASARLKRDTTLRRGSRERGRIRKRRSGGRPGGPLPVRRHGRRVEVS